MATMNQDQQFEKITVTFFDNNTPPRPAKIDVSDRQPSIIVNNPSVAQPANVVVADDGTSMTFDLLAGTVGDTDGGIDCDINTEAGVDLSKVFEWGETVTVTPGP